MWCVHRGRRGREEKGESREGRGRRARGGAGAACRRGEGGRGAKGRGEGRTKCGEGRQGRAQGKGRRPRCRCRAQRGCNEGQNHRLRVGGKARALTAERRLRPRIKGRATESHRAPANQLLDQQSLPTNLPSDWIDLVCRIAFGTIATYFCPPSGIRWIPSLATTTRQSKPLHPCAVLTLALRELAWAA